MRARFAFSLVSPALALLGAAQVAIAQESPAPEPAPEDEAIELSSFTVSAVRDTGYVASGTLAGSRLRTELKDVAASISVSTREFMDDINATSAQDLLVYTLGTEISGTGGNFSGAGLDTAWANMDFLAGHPTDLPTRVRGVAGADKARDYFISEIAFDTYNTERVEISRGPNSILYGLGSPGGIVNATTIAPLFTKDKTSLDFQYGSFGSWRAALDHNHVLVDDKLAVRVAAKSSDDRFEQEEAFVRDRRGFIAASFRPFKDTTIRGNFEIEDQEARRPQVRPPFDMFSWWWDIGQPSYDPTTGIMRLNADVRTVSPLASGARTAGSTGTDIDSSVVSTAYPGWSQSVGVVYSDPYGRTPGITGTSAHGTENWNLNGRSDGAGGLADSAMRGLALNVDYLRRLHAGEVGASFWQNQMNPDARMFDYRKHMIEGPNKGESLDATAGNITIEQTFLDRNAGIELAYDEQHLDSFGYTPYSWLTYGYTIDINEKLPNGLANPNFGRPVMADVGWGSSKTFDRKAGRATGYYKLDLSESGGGGTLGKILGRHIFTGSYGRQKLFREQFGGRPQITGLDYYHTDRENSPFDIITRNDRRTLVHVSYVGPSVLNTAEASAADVSGIRARQDPSRLTSIPVFAYRSPSTGATAPNAWGTQDVSIISQSSDNKQITANWEGERSQTEVDSKVFVWQGYLFDGHVVPTVGWRRDDFKTYNAVAPGNGFDPATGQMITDERLGWNSPTLDDGENNTSWGVVAHVPRRWLGRFGETGSLSFFANQSNNATVGPQRVTILGEPLPPDQGTTDEYGFAVTAWNDKLSLRFTKFETAIENQGLGSVNSAILRIVRLPLQIEAANATGANDGRPEALAAWNAWATSPEGAGQIETFESLNSRLNEVTSTSDVVAEGYEAEMIFNPTSTWRMALNVANIEAERTNSARDLAEYVEDTRALWYGPAGDLIPQNETSNLRTIAQREIVNPVHLANVQDGASMQELRKWRVNLVTNYAFTSGTLDGFNVGGAARWQDKAAIGYPIIRDSVVGLDTYDIDNPYYGPAETNFDFWVGYRRKIAGDVRWTIQLNLKNVFGDDDLIPVSTQPDGSIAAWRIPEPMTWTITNRFEF